MIAKERTIPLKIQVGEALKRRIPIRSPYRDELQEELNRRWAGYWGEQAIDHHLTLLDEKNYLIFHDLNLPWHGYTFQIDTLLISTNFALILEVKNISGTLFFDQVFHQLIRTNFEGVEEGFADPICQAQHHQIQLQHFWNCHRLTQMPVDFGVVMCNKRSILKTNPRREVIFEKVFKAHHILKYVQEMERTYTEEILSQKDLAKIKRVLIKNNTPPRRLFMDRYLDSLKDIRTGVHCPNCFTIPMKRVNRKWHCTSCGVFSRDAHLETLRDYFLLVDSKISNKSFREFMQLSSSYVSSRMLADTQFPSSGATKDRLYYPPVDLYKG